MYKYSAPLIFPVSSKPLENHVIICDKNGQILEISPLEKHDPAGVQFFEGALIPGLINTHCHLELSHMKGVVETGTTLLPFISAVVSFRDVQQDIIDQAIVDGDKEMYDSGIVAVGDICNKLDTASVKLKSTINYYSFVEMFDFMQDDLAQPTFEGYMKVYEGQSTSGFDKKSVVPHAPYTVSKKLFELLNQVNSSGATTISIHNQETPAENEYFKSKSGPFEAFYSKFNFDMSWFKALGKGSIYYALDHMSAANRTLFVHNTMTTEEDILAAQKWNKQTYWASCPNANLYIENRLPDYSSFLKTDAKVTLGTDSLTSNWQLSIVDEMATVLKFCSYVGFENVLKWATLNGAEALQYADRLGSLEVGKTPGIVNINVEKNRNSYVLINNHVNRVI